MKKAFIILFVLISTVVCATPYIVVYLNTEKVHIEYELGYEELEINGKIHILAQFLDTLLQQKKNTDLEIYLFFESGMGHRDSSYYTVSFGKFDHYKKWKWKQGYYSSEKVTTEGLKFVINDRMLNISQILNFVNASIEQLAYIKANQKETFIKKRDAYGSKFDTLYSIPASEVKKYMTSKSKIVDNVLKNKIHRVFLGFDGDSTKIDKEKQKRFDYFFQNGKFYFYNISTLDKLSQDEIKYGLKKYYPKDTLIVDNVFEIFHPKEYYDGSFIFTNDSTFYYLPYLEERAKGAFVIKDMALQRPPILRYYSEHKPISKITLYLDGYNDSYKAMFIPDSGVVIANYGYLEDEMIHNEILKNKSQPPTITHIDKKQAVLIITLLFSLLLNFWLWWRKR